MKLQAETVRSAQLEDISELESMLKQLPEEERLRVEGIIIGIGMRCNPTHTAAQDSA